MGASGWEYFECHMALFDENGSHSILDIIKGIEETPTTCAAAPLSQQELLEILGTTQPTHEQVLQQRDRLMDLRRNWVASYVIVYKEGVPDEIYFTGFSGD